MLGALVLGPRFRRDDDMGGEMSHVCAALLEPEPVGGFTVTFPEIGFGATYSETWDAALHQAEDMLEEVKRYRSLLIENAVTEDEKLLEKYFEVGEEGLSEADIQSAIRTAVLSGKFFAVTGGDVRGVVVDRWRRRRRRAAQGWRRQQGAADTGHIGGSKRHRAATAVPGGDASGDSRERMLHERGSGERRVVGAGRRGR